MELTNLQKYGVENYSLTDDFKKSIAKENHPYWKGGITPDRQDFYSTSEWKKVYPQVWKRDKAICQKCGIEKNNDIQFHIHHIVSFQDKSLRCDINNLVLLCKDCHIFVHSNSNISKEFIKVVQL